MTWRKNGLPVVLHAQDCPTFRRSFIKPFVERADVRLAVVGELARGVVVMDVETEARPGTCGSPLQHLQIAIGITKGGDGSAANVGLNTNRFTILVVDEINRR